LFACRDTYRCDYDRCDSDDRDSIFYFINILSHSKFFVGCYDDQLLNDDGESITSGK
jgi:hypothetical protein